LKAIKAPTLFFVQPVGNHEKDLEFNVRNISLRLPDLFPRNSDSIPTWIREGTEQIRSDPSCEKIIGLVHKYLFQLDGTKIGEEELKKDLVLLKNAKTTLESGVRQDTLLLCRAEIQFRLGQIYPALIEFYLFRYHLGEKDNPFLKNAEFKLNRILKMINKNNLRLDQDQIAKDIFNLIFQERKDQTKFDEKRLKYLLGMLDLIEKTQLPVGDKLVILYLRAESLFRMNEYKKTYVAFNRLKLRLDSKSHPLFAEVESRMNNIRRQIIPIKKETGLRAGNTHLLLASGFLILFFFVLLTLDYRKTDGKDCGSEIVEKEKLIMLDEMREQDGRCSARNMDEYQELKMTLAKMI